MFSCLMDIHIPYQSAWDQVLSLHLIQPPINVLCTLELVDDDSITKISAIYMGNQDGVPSS